MHKDLGPLLIWTRTVILARWDMEFHDIDTGELLNISDGTLYLTSVKEIQKGVNGAPGGMEGIIVYNNYNVLGKIKKKYRGQEFLELLTGLMSCSQIRLQYNWQKKKR